MHTYAYLWRYILSYCGTSTVPAFSSLIYKIYLTFYDWDGLWLLDMSKVKSFQFSCELGTTLSFGYKKNWKYGRPKIANMLFKKTFRFNQKIIRNDSYVLGGHIKNFSACYKYVKSLRVIEEYIILIDILKFIYIYIELCLNMQILRHFCRCKAKAENNAMASGKRGKERRVSIDHCLLFCKQSPSFCENHKT